MATVTAKFGDGGANLIPGGSAGSPDLATALRDLTDDVTSLRVPVQALVTTAASATFDAATRAKAQSMIAVVAKFPGATTLPGDAFSAALAWIAADGTLITKIQTDVNAMGGAAVTGSADATYNATEQTLIDALVVRINLLCNGVLATAVPATYTATTEQILSSLLIRMNAMEAFTQKSVKG